LKVKRIRVNVKDFGDPNANKPYMNLVVISPDQFAQSGPAPEKSLIFGASLHEILERAPFTTKGGLCIPLVLHRCFSEISKKGRYAYMLKARVVCYL
jgi:hypothetical protein